ncbi:MAG TPA: SRPBCC domain-containing protein [Myxococcota bacterium]|jgi:activator of HSP90 ATPase|nr:SRPBCC domain-containing protein [Myxococcota bacterium]
MAKTIVQKVKLAAKPAALYALYVDEKKHSAATGAAARIPAKAGAAFTAWDGYIAGTTLHLDPGKMVVQTWRAADWKKSDRDSVLSLWFAPAAGGGGEVTMVHANVPDAHHKALAQGWIENYWKPWKAYLKKR